MSIYVGLDASVNETAIFLVDDEGRVLQEKKVASEPEEIAAGLEPFHAQLHRIGVEASSIGLQSELSERHFEVIVIETHHTQVALSTMRNKTDRNDARGIAQLMRLGWFKAIHVKGIDAHHVRAAPSARKLVVRKVVDTENEIRGLLRGFGLKIGKVSRGTFDDRAETLTQGVDALLREVIDRLLAVRRTLLEQYWQLHALVVKESRADPVCRRLMTALGVGPIAALAFRAGHQAYSEHRWVNRMMAMTLDMIGGSSYIWHWKHAVFHPHLRECFRSRQRHRSPRARSARAVTETSLVASLAGVDDPHRFKRSCTVGAHFGMTPRKHQSGEIAYDGHNSNAAIARSARRSMTRLAHCCDAAPDTAHFRAWGTRLAKRRGLKKVTVAVSRKLAVILHRMWLDSTDFHWESIQPSALAMSA